MSRKFQDFMSDVEREAHREGPKATAELAAFDAHFRLAGELLSLRRAPPITANRSPRPHSRDRDRERVRSRGGRGREAGYGPG